MIKDFNDFRTKRLYQDFVTARTALRKAQNRRKARQSLEVAKAKKVLAKHGSSGGHQGGRSSGGGYNKPNLSGSGSMATSFRQRGGGYNAANLSGSGSMAASLRQRGGGGYNNYSNGNKVTKNYSYSRGYNHNSNGGRQQRQGGKIINLNL